MGTGKGLLNRGNLQWERPPEIEPILKVAQAIAQDDAEGLVEDDESESMVAKRRTQGLNRAGCAIQGAVPHGGR